MNHETNPSPRHEGTDWSFRVVMLFMAILTGGAVISVGLCYAVHLAFLKYDRPPAAAISPVADLHRLPPEPRLQVDDAADLAQFRQAEDAILNSYGWIDPQAGKVRIPIARAIDLVAERGLPARQGGKQ